MRGPALRSGSRPRRARRDVVAAAGEHEREQQEGADERALQP